MKMKAIRIKRCPFCKGKPEIANIYRGTPDTPDWNDVLIVCSLCGAKGPVGGSYDQNDSSKYQTIDYNNAEREAIKLWNKRVEK